VAWRRAGAIGVLVLAAACSSSASDPSALDFSAPTVGGETLDLRTYAGKSIAFWFWAPY
jgi:hypothetical protein